MGSCDSRSGKYCQSNDIFHGEPWWENMDHIWKEEIWNNIYIYIIIIVIMKIRWRQRRRRRWWLWNNILRQLDGKEKKNLLSALMNSSNSTILLCYY